jgi:hypothetical protein
MRRIVESLGHVRDVALEMLYELVACIDSGLGGQGLYTRGYPA